MYMYMKVNLNMYYKYMNTKIDFDMYVHGNELELVHERNMYIFT
jgi:hypothetical protein